MCEHNRDIIFTFLGVYPIFYTFCFFLFLSVSLLQSFSLSFFFSYLFHLRIFFIFHFLVCLSFCLFVFRPQNGIQTFIFSFLKHISKKGKTNHLVRLTDVHKFSKKKEKNSRRFLVGHRYRKRTFWKHSFETAGFDFFFEDDVA